MVNAAWHAICSWFVRQFRNRYGWRKNWHCSRKRQYDIDMHNCKWNSIVQLLVKWNDRNTCINAKAPFPNENKTKMNYPSYFISPFHCRKRTIEVLSEFLHFSQCPITLQRNETTFEFWNECDYYQKLHQFTKHWALTKIANGAKCKTIHTQSVTLHGT